eukprot:gene27338-4637_t
MVTVIFVNLGTKGVGETSAYSIFNPNIEVVSKVPPGVSKGLQVVSKVASGSCIRLPSRSLSKCSRFGLRCLRAWDKVPQVVLRCLQVVAKGDIQVVSKVVSKVPPGVAKVPPGRVFKGLKVVSKVASRSLSKGPPGVSKVLQVVSKVPPRVSKCLQVVSKVPPGRCLKGLQVWQGRYNGAARSCLRCLQVVRVLKVLQVVSKVLQGRCPKVVSKVPPGRVYGASRSCLGSYPVVPKGPTRSCLERWPQVVLRCLQVVAKVLQGRGKGGIRSCLGDASRSWQGASRSCLKVPPGSSVPKCIQVVPKVPPGRVKVPPGSEVSKVAYRSCLRCLQVV